MRPHPVLLFLLALLLWLGLPGPAPSRTLPVIPVQNRTECADWKARTPNVTRIVYAPDGKTLAVAGMGVSLRDARTGAGRWCLDTLDPRYKVARIAFAPDGRTLAVLVGMHSEIRLYRTADGSLLRELNGHTDYVHDLAFSPDGRFLITASADGTLRWWDPASDRQTAVRMLQDFEYAPNAVAFAPDGKTLAVATPGHVQLRRADDGALIRELAPQLAQSWDRLTFTPDGQSLIVWHLAAPGFEVLQTVDGRSRLSRQFPGVDRGDSAIHEIAISPDGRRMAVLGETWDWLIPRSPLTAFTRSAVNIRYHLQIWQTENWQPQLELTGSGYIGTMAFTPDGHTLISDWERRLAEWSFIVPLN